MRLLIFPLAAAAQQPGGRVTGFVYDATTHLPLRFAVVQLVPQTTAPEQLTTGTMPDGSTVQKPEPRLELVSGTSGMDGRFDLEGIPAGDYYAAAQMLGYTEPGMAVASKMDASAEEVKRALEMFPKVHVSAGQVETTNLMLQRGGVIAGRLQFADGSPMIDTQVGADAVVPPAPRSKADLQPVSPQRGTLLTLITHQGRSGFVSDDQGNFRIFGLPPGKYMISTGFALGLSGARVMMSNGAAPTKGEQPIFPELILVYAPGVFRQKEAKIYEIRGEEEITDVNLQINPTGLHTVTGKVLVGEDRHVPTGASITMQAIGSQPPGSYVFTEDDGSFQIHDLPEDSYTLSVQATDLDKSSGLNYAYKTLKQTVIVGQHDVVLDTLSPVPLKPGEADPE